MQPMNFIQRSRAINGDYGAKYKKEAQILRVQKGIASNFDGHPDFQSEEEASINGEPRRLIVCRHKSEQTQKDIIAYPGENFGIGDVVECYGAHWLITQKDPNTTLYCKGLMELCTLKLRWQNVKTLDIVECWAIIKNPYSTNVDSGKAIETLYGKYKIYVPRTPETLAVAPDKRFIIGVAGDLPTVYKLTFPDPSSESYDGIGNGILIWNVVSDETQMVNDNAELGIANYIDPGIMTDPEPTPPDVPDPDNPDPDNPDPPGPDNPGPDNPDPDTPDVPEVPEVPENLWLCRISGKPEVIVGYSRKFTCSFFEEEKEEDPENTEQPDTGDVPEEEVPRTPPTPRWFIKNAEELEGLVELIPNGETCTVKVADDDDAVNKTIVLCCESEAGDSKTAQFKIRCVVM